MLRNYIKIALRNIRRYYAHSILNISGMAIGMACALLILLWVQNEWSYDRQFDNAGNIYRLIENQNPSGGDASLYAITPAPLARVLKEEYPEVIRSASYDPHMELRLKKEDEFEHETAVAMVDKDFLKMFDIRFIQGDINTALNEPHNVILTEEMAHKYFGNGEVVGKTLQESLGYLVTVTGVVKKPHNSHIRFDFLVPMELMKERGGPPNEWDFRCYNYIELKKGTDSKVVETKIGDFLKKHVKGSDSKISLQNIKKIHLYSSRKYTYDVSGHGDIANVRIMGIIAAFILLMACINFMNLSTAQSARRAGEIGVRKVAGANKRKIILQFLGESLLIVFVAHVIAMILVELLLPVYNNLTGIQLDVNYQSAGLYIGLFSMILICGLLAGSYPAFYLSSLKPMNIMKGMINKNPGNAPFRRTLVIFQFSLSVMLIICTLIVGKQFSFIQHKKLGFNKENIGYFMFPTAPWDPRLDIIKKELLSNTEILNATRVFYNYENPLNIEGTSGGYHWTGKKEGEDVLFYELSADADYAKTFQLELKEGRFFSSEFSTDNAAIVINERAAAILGFKNPIGEIITAAQGSELTVIGVVKDFNFKSLHYKIEPLIMRLGGSNTFFIRMKPEHIISTVESVGKMYNSFKPDIPLDFHFLDDDFNSLYRTEQRMSIIFRYFSLLAIIISCLGLTGLSSFMTERRTKEIGIRKANGAKSSEIFYLLSKEYILWVLISIIIACPVAWFAMHMWLRNFAYRVTMSWLVFALAGLVALIIALLTVSFQSYHAAWKNPVEALRYE
jgi:putative ABC transport system permease protein